MAKIVAIDLIIVLFSIVVRADPGFDYGVGAGDSFLTASDESSSVDVVNLPPFSFYGSSNASVYVRVVQLSLYGYG